MKKDSLIEVETPSAGAIVQQAEEELNKTPEGKRLLKEIQEETTVSEDRSRTLLQE